MNPFKRLAREEKTPEYRAWTAMKQRCVNPNHPAFYRCGAKGATVCKEWIDDFERFLADVGPRPTESHRLERFPDVHGNYEPGNVAWIADRINYHPKYECGRTKSSQEYNIWLKMKRRCFDTSDDAYPDYGGRGITVCGEWRNDFVAFLAYIGKRPGPEYSIDRINNDGNYEPGNVRWATRIQQANNRRSRKSQRKCRGQKSSKYKGVNLTASGKWAAAFRGKHLGLFREEFDAATAYNLAAEEHYGSAGIYNLPEVK